MTTSVLKSSAPPPHSSNEITTIAVTSALGIPSPAVLLKSAWPGSVWVPCPPSVFNEIQSGTLSACRLTAFEGTMRFKTGEGRVRAGGSAYQSSVKPLTRSLTCAVVFFPCAPAAYSAQPSSICG